MTMERIRPINRLRFLSLLLCLLLLPTGGGSARSGAAASATAPSPYQKEFEAVWQAVRDQFYDEKTGGLDWGAVGERYRARLGAVRDDRAFTRLANEMLAQLRASHTRLFTPDDFEFYLLPDLHARQPRRRLRHIGVLTHADRPAVAAAVLDGSPAARAGLRAGDVLVSVDGALYRGLTQFSDGPVTLSYRRADKAGSVRVTPVEEGPLEALLKATRQSVRVLRQPDGRRVGYVHLWSMAGDRFAAALEAAVTGPLHDTDGLVLDLREGFGGSPEGYADVFFRPDIRVWSRAHGQAAGRQSWQGYSRPLVVLIDDGTRSAKEWLAWTLQTSGRATLVGQRSAGAVLAAKGIPVSDRFYLSLAVLDLKLNGERLEGRGVTPDVPVPGDIEETAFLQKGMDALQAKRGATSRSSTPGARSATRGSG